MVCFSSYDAHCLRNPPGKNEMDDTDTQILPGKKFDINSQCELYFGPGYQVCPNVRIIFFFLVSYENTSVLDETLRAFVL